ncbi:TetR/AcrR family transcriptional regulator [Nocardia thailandica]|uniref:TetR/AcrR family transcriptional regulator n=1 Tax=Nocardia thailandica TaxID=257275 RepID=A0ABW6PRN8_9NOCA|nr:TetR/AcrR family transcriptional regulator [Nocardia thailandica]
MSALPLRLVVAKAMAEPEVPLTGTDHQILDATLELYQAYGSRMSMDDIAVRAKVGRRTVFRRFGSKDGVVEQLVVRELGRMLQLLRDTAAAAEDPVTGAVEVFVVAVRAVGEHPALDRLARHEPQVMLDALRADDAALLDLMDGFVADRIRSGQRHGTVALRNPELIAETLVRLVFANLLMPSRAANSRDEKALRMLARTVITPLLSVAD